MNLRYAILLCGALSACETVVDVDFQGEYEPQLAVSGIFTPDNLWSVHLSRSTAIEDTVHRSSLFVTDAMVVIAGETGFRDTLQYVDNGMYRTRYDHRPTEGARYTLRVEKAGLPSLDASARAPELTSVLLAVTPTHDERAVRYSTRFRIQDRPGNNYYRVELYQLVPYCSPFSNITPHDGVIRDASGNLLEYRFLWFESSAPSFVHDLMSVDDILDNTNGDSNQPFGAAFFSDALFDGQGREFEIHFVAEKPEEPQIRFMLVVSVLSPDLFAHDRTLEAQDEYLFAGDPFINRPIPVYSNVQGGLGIFAGFTTDAYRFDEKGDLWEEDTVDFGAIPECPN